MMRGSFISGRFNILNLNILPQDNGNVVMNLVNPINTELLYLSRVIRVHIPAGQISSKKLAKAIAALFKLARSEGPHKVCTNGCASGVLPFGNHIFFLLKTALQRCKHAWGEDGEIHSHGLYSWAENHFPDMMVASKPFDFLQN